MWAHSILFTLPIWHKMDNNKTDRAYLLQRVVVVEGTARPKLAVVLSGGGLRSAAQIGVLQVLEEYGLRPQCIVGTSGGAIVAALYASGLRPQEIAALYRSIIGREHRFIDLALGQFWQAFISWDLSKVKGLIKGERIRKYLHKQFRLVKKFTDFTNLPPDRKAEVVELYLTAVDINDGSEVVFCAPRHELSARYTESLEKVRLQSDISLADAVRSSIGIPGIFVPFASAGTHYVDGGLRDNLPLMVAVKLGGADRVLGVDLGYAGLRQEALVEKGIVEILSQSIDIMSMDQLAADIRDKELSQVPMVILNPMIYDVGLLDTEYIPEMINRGRLLAETFFARQGLKPQLDPAENLRLLFAGIRQPTLFPTKEDDEYQLFRQQLTVTRSVASSEPTILNKVGDFFDLVREKIVLACGLLLLACGLILVWGDPLQVQGVGIGLIIVGLVAVYRSTIGVKQQ